MMLTTLDPRSLFMALAVITLSLSLCMFHFMLAKKTYPGFSTWCLSFVWMGSAVLLISLEGTLPQLVTRGGGHLILYYGAFLFYAGFRKFSEAPIAGRGHAIALGLAILSYLFFLLVVDNLPARVFLTSAVLAAYSCLSLKTLVQRIRGKLNRTNWLLTAALGLVSVFYPPGAALYHPSAGGQEYSSHRQP